MRVLGLAVCLIALTSTADAFGPADVVSTLLKPLRGPFGVKDAKGDSRRARTLEEHHQEEMSAEEEAEEESSIKFGYVIGLLALAGTCVQPPPSAESAVRGCLLMARRSVRSATGRRVKGRSRHHHAPRTPRRALRAPRDART